MKVFVTRKLPGRALDRLARQASVDLWEDELPPSYEELVRRCRDVDGLLCMLTDRVDGPLIAQAPRLRVISNMAAGYDNVDIETAGARGIPVGNTPGVLTEATADLCFALILAVARRVPEADRILRGGGWRTWHPSFLLGTELFGKTLGLVGFGRIGQAVARRAAGFSMRILYSDRAEAPAGAPGRHVPLEELLAAADFVSLHVPLTSQTRKLISEPQLRAMKPTAFLVNTARGGVVDGRALVRALEEGWISGAGLDVYETEPLPADDPLLRAPRTVLLPHLGSATHTTRERMATLAVENCLAGLAGDPLPHPVALLSPSTVH